MKNEIRYFSMFTGVGGFELGLSNDNKQSSEEFKDRQGRNGDSNESGEMLCTTKKSTLRCVGMSEWDKYSSQVLRYRFPTIKNWGDCTKIRPEDLPDFDMLCGGFPCQAFSIAGKRKGFEDTRGTMFFEVARILKVKRPKIVLLENVKGLLNHNKGETFRVIIQTLDELGYEVQWMVLNSKFFGVPQNRERVFIIGNLRGERRPEILPFGYTDKQIDFNIKRTQSDVSGKGYTSQQDRVYLPEGTMCCLPNANPDDKLNITDGFKIRRLTPIECERLQGFPDNWTEFGIDEQGNKVKMSDTQRYKQMGNAVTTNVVRAVGEKIACSEEKQKEVKNDNNTSSI